MPEASGAGGAGRVRLFGEAAGAAVHEVTLRTGGGLLAHVLTWGAVIRDLQVPVGGEQRSVVLGFERLEDYLAHSPFFGAIAGRYANRIAGGRFAIDGVTHALDRNEAGRTTLHGGRGGFSQRIWTIEALDEASVLLSLLSGDGDQGFPGRVRATCRYSLSDEDGLTVALQAETDRPTHVNLAQHSYFNLDGGGTVEGHWLQIHAEAFTEVDPWLIPTGRCLPVAGLGLSPDRAVRVADCRLLDLNFVLSEPAGAGQLRRAARMVASGGDLELQVRTTKPGLQVYDGHLLAVPVPGLGGRRYGRRAGLCLETQFFPDSPNRPEFPGSLLQPGQVYDHRTDYRFLAPG